ncbi:MAG TPA: ABC transporter substrate-binding protein [Solirubrobacteraceae bacterium]|nr:ABC transporter substrate-binding protein [Solirubrobacteraceae bacterium]
MRRIGALVAAGLTAVAIAACGSSSGSGPVTLNWMVFPEPSGSFAKAAADCSAASHGAYKININFLSNASDQQRQTLVQRLAAGDPSIDILAMDVDWTAEFAHAGWIRQWTGANRTAVSKGVLAGPLKTATYQGKLWAAPINSNTELLWYRKDLVKTPPKTWGQMIDDAERLAKEGKPHYIEEQGAKYEGLTVWFNSLVNSAGGGIVGPNNTVIVGPSAKIAAQIMKRLATSAGADPGLNASQEGPGNDAFDAGVAAFQINYPFVWSGTEATAPAIFKHMGYAPFPQVIPGKPARSTIGGYNLGVSSHTKHPQLAFQAVRCLIQPKNQIRDAIKGGLAPVLASIYDEPSFEKAYPFHQLIKNQLQHYGIRPQTPQYQDVTLAIQDTLQPAADINPDTIVDKLRNEIKTALKGQSLL